ncbi:hypothetical protein RZO55_01605 [Clostridium boliviensis]|uniref:DUF4163 domain-containing protein n=1 Tax=Clostridium boliviensis TaxID=318465 RepID=A0ABU4GF80_9CLOT|nr:hypothetical protein [Clostridium boliviensis]MDW2796284.1 hypothetical protein [Clostridium boliviensis]
MVICFFVAGCGKKAVKVETQTQPLIIEQESEATNNTDEPETIDNRDELETKDNTDESETANNIDKPQAADQSYTMSIYTDAPNKNSSIKIQYPKFINNDTLNTLIYDKVQSFAKIDTSIFSSDAVLTVDYQSAVTLQNNKIVSIVFWGTSYIKDGAYPVNNLNTLNVDLQSMKEITFKDLYTTNADFEKVFFDKAAFPSNPLTSYDEASFPEMLKLQSPEYQTVDPFTIADNISCFLKPDGVVLRLLLQYVEPLPPDTAASRALRVD